MRREFCLYKRGDKKVWYYTTYVNGRRVYKSTGKKTKAEALDYCLTLSNNNQIHNQVAKNITFETFSKGFFDKDSEYVKEKKITQGSMYAYSTILELKLIPFFGKYKLTEITPSLIKSWMLSIEECKARTINTFLSVLKIIMQEACFKEIITTNPCLNVKRLKLDSKEKEVFTLNEIKLLFSSEWKNNKVKLMCKISALTGMRESEIRALTLEKIKKYYIVVDSNFETIARKVKGTKSGKVRYVPITESLYKEIVLFTDNRKGFIFNGEHLKTRKSPITSSCIVIYLKKQLKELGIYREGLTFHSFRHFFNSQLVINGINSEIVRKIIGHESENMTEHYLHIKQNDLDKIREIQSRIF